MAKSYKKRYEELIEKVRDIEAQSSLMHQNLFNILIKSEFSFIIEDVQKQVQADRRRKITPKWLQRRYVIGYARAMMILDMLKEMGVVR